MVSQTKITEGNGKMSDRRPSESDAKASTFARDAIDLCELQLRLLVTDLKETMTACRTGSMLLIVATGLLIAAAPLYLLALAAWLVAQFELSWVEGLLITAVGASLISAALFVAGWTIVRQGAAKLDRSRQEFRENLKWAKQMLAPKSRGKNI